MKAAAFLLVISLALPASAPTRTAKEKVWGWEELRTAPFQTLGAKLSDARRESWHRTQVQRVFGKPPKSAQFAATGKVQSVIEKDGKWLITLGPDQLQRKSDSTASSAPVSTFSAAALQAIGRQGQSSKKPSPPRRSPVVTWTMDVKPKIKIGGAMKVSGTITDTTWTDDRISVSLDNVRKD